MGNRRSVIRAVKSAHQHTTTAATVGRARRHTGCAMQRPSHPHQPRHWWMLNCLRICRPTLSVERNRRLNGGQQTLSSTRCWLQKPSAISASAPPTSVASEHMFSAAGQIYTDKRLLPKRWKKSNKNHGKKSRFRFFQFLAKNRDFRFRIQESSITNCV